MYMQIYKDRNQAHDEIYGNSQKNKAMAIAIALRNKELVRQERWDRANVCKYCNTVLPKSGICNCQK